jgi:sugar lactone lactonase YvrE
MPELRTLMSGLALGGSPRWHAGRLWFADWGAHEIIAVDHGGTSEVIARIPTVPFCIDFLPAGRGAASMAGGQRTGQVLMIDVSVPSAGRPK